MPGIDVYADTHDPRYLFPRRRHRHRAGAPEPAPRHPRRRRPSRHRRRRHAALVLARQRACRSTLSRLRIAEVTRGTLVRDASVKGRVVAAVSPTLYSTAPSTVTLKVAAGDTVKKRRGAGRARIARPVRRAQARASSYAQLEAEVARQQFLSQASRSCWPSAKPTPPRSNACRPSARWNATNAWRKSASSPRSTTRRPRTRSTRPRSARATPPRPPGWKATTSAWPSRPRPMNWTASACRWPMPSAASTN